MDGSIRSIGFVAVAALLIGCAGDYAGMKGDGYGSPDGGVSTDANAPALTLSTEGSATPGVGEEVAIRAYISFTSAPVESYDWTVTDPQSQKVTFDVNSAGDRISFTPQVAGTHHVTCTVTLTGTGEILNGSASIQVESGAKKLTYTARIIPSPTSKLPPRDVVVQVADVSQTGLNWQVDPGQTVQVQVTDSGGKGIPTVVRLIQVVQDPLPREFYLESGSGQVRVTDIFHALFLPQSPSATAELKPNVAAAGLGATWPVALDKGVQVAGSVQQSDGTALVGAKVTVHTESNGVLVPSSIGTTDASGAFSVQVRPGDATLTVVPPQDSGLPVALLESTELAVTSQAQGWVFKFSKAKPVSVSGKVTGSNGKDVAVGAKVVMTTTLPSGPAVGGLTAPKALAASGLYSRVLSSNSQGELVDASGATSFTMPEGAYQVAVWPGAQAAVEEGYFLTMHSLVSGTPAKLSLALAARATLSGTVVDQEGTPVQARVVAAAQTGSFTTTSDAKGAFNLYLNDNASYSLVIRSASKKVSTYIEPQLQIKGDKALSTIKLPRALVLSGKVTTTGNLGISGSLVRIWCSGADCPSHDIVDETTVLQDGFFELRVPPTTE